LRLPLTFAPNEILSGGNMRLHLIVLLLSMATLSLAQQWEVQAPNPTSEEIYSVYFFNTNLGFIGTSDAGLYRTNDGGQTWSNVNMGTAEQWIEGITFADSQNGWAVGPNSTVYHTTDGGLTWQLAETGFGVYATRAYFSSRTNGWLLGCPVLHTTDGGVTWDTVSTQDGKLCGTTGAFTDSLHGWVLKQFPKIVYHTTDGGATWSEYSYTGFYNAYHLFFLNENEGWMTTHESDDESIYVARLHHTTDAGQTWTEILVDSSHFFASALFINSNHGFVTGTQGITETMNGGITWHNVSTIRSGTNDVCYDGANGLYVVGDGSLILRSEDIGLTWHQISNGYTSGDWQKMTFFDSQNGWIAGGNGTLLHTTNGGGLWTVVYMPDPDLPTRYAVALDSLTVVAAASSDWHDESELYRSIDGGETWTTQTPGHFGWVKCLSFPDPLNGWAITADSIYHTNDGGINWQAQAASQWGEEIYFKDALHGWVCGSQSYLWATVNGGETWEPWTASGLGVHDLYFTDLNNGWGLIGLQATLVHTTDGGAHWSFYTLPEWDCTESMSFADAMNGYIVARRDNSTENRLWETHDGGLTWGLNPENSPGIEYATDMVFTSAREGWILSGSHILHNSGLLGTDSRPSLKPQEFSVSAFPNPFNPTTTISFSLPQAGDVSVAVYDMLGRRVESNLARTQMYTAGEHRLIFDAAGLSSGTYFVRMQAPGVTKTKKIELLR
jgi:photosystem II stability/assembly factor-like uncharacterized protein